MYSQDSIAKRQFETQKGTFNDRFVLRYTDKTLGINDFETTSGNQIVVSNKIVDGIDLDLLKNYPFPIVIYNFIEKYSI